MTSDEQQEADPVCEICGSDEGISKYQLGGEVVLRCERHAAGVDLAAEEIYWRRRSSSDESNSEKEGYRLGREENHD